MTAARIGAEVTESPTSPSTAARTAAELTESPTTPSIATRAGAFFTESPTAPVPDKARVATAIAEVVVANYLETPFADFPRFAVYIAPGYAPQSVIPGAAWVDVSRFVTRVRTTRAFQHELGQVQAGTATFSVTNFHGEWNPWNTASPFYAGGNGLRAMMPIKVTADWLGIVYPIFYGFVDAFPQRWQSGPTRPTLELTATDGFKLLNLDSLTQLGYAAVVEADGPSAYYRLGEQPRAPYAVDSSGNGHDGTYTGSPTLGTTGALVGDSDTAFDGNSSTGWVSVPSAAAPTGAGAFSIEAWFKTTDTSATVNHVIYQQGTTGEINLSIYGGTGHPGSLVFQAPASGGSFVQINPVTNYADGAWHHVVGVRASDGKSCTLYVDGAVVGTGIGSAAYPLSGSPAVGIGGAVDPTNAGATGPTWTGQLDEVAIYATALSAGQVAAHHAAGTSVGAGDTSGQRIARLRDLKGWPAAMSSIETGTSVVTPITQSLLSTSVLSEMQAVQLAEDGLLFINAAGNLVFHGRGHPLTTATSLTSQRTLGGDVAGGQSPYRLAGTETVEDDLDIWNEIPVSRAGGAVITASDGPTSDTTTSQGKFGKRTLQGLTGLQLTSDTECADRANWRLAHDKDPRPRVPTVVIDPRTDPTNLFPFVLACDFQWRVTFAHKALGGGDDLALPALIESISHDIGPSTMTTALALTPADTGTYFTWDGPAGTGWDDGVWSY